MEITTRQVQDVLVVDMAGRLDSTSSGASYDQLVAIAKSGPKKVVLNLGKLDFVTSAGLRVILTMSKLLRSASGEMRIFGPNAAVREVLTTSGFNSLIRITDGDASTAGSWD